MGPFEGGPGAVSQQASSVPPSATDHSITRVTPTSSDQRIDVDYDQEHDHSQDMVTDNDEEVIVDNTDDEDCMKRPRPGQLTQHNGHGPPVANGLGDKNSTEEATSSVEIDSATDSMPSRTAGTTPNSDSYVSTSESAEPSSKAQVLEELKARIRELEGSPHYKCFICKEKCKTLIISKICGHYLCEECWITESCRMSSVDIPADGRDNGNANAPPDQFGKQLKDIFCSKEADCQVPDRAPGV
uniref:RING-type domain-containing protein n=1 Tax=Anopheles maculatus TaxID=74869 RepID=A0A182SR52_9DIPT